MSETEAFRGVPDGLFRAAEDHRNACLVCLLQGLEAIGIRATATDTIDFGAIDSDALCATMAHAIETCLFAKHYNIKALTATFQSLREEGLRISVIALADGLVAVSWPLGEGG